MYATFTTLKSGTIYCMHISSPDSVWFNRIQITDVPKPVLVHLRPDHFTTNVNVKVNLHSV